MRFGFSFGFATLAGYQMAIHCQVTISFLLVVAEVPAEKWVAMADAAGLGAAARVRARTRCALRGGGRGYAHVSLSQGEYKAKY